MYVEDVHLPAVVLSGPFLRAESRLEELKALLVESGQRFPGFPSRKENVMLPPSGRSTPLWNITIFNGEIYYK